MATNDNPLSAFFRGFQGAQQRVQQQEQQALNNQLNEQLRAIQLLNAQRQLAELNKTPQQKMAEQLNIAIAEQALKSGALVPAPSGLPVGTPVAEPQAIPFTAPELATAQTQGNLNDLLSQVNAAQKPIQFATPLPGTPGFLVSPTAATEKQASDIEKAKQLAKAKFEATPAGYQIFTDNFGNVSYVPKNPGQGTVQPILSASGEQLKGKTGSSGQLTISQQNSALSKAAKAGVDPEQFRDPTSGQIDYQNLSIATGKAEGEAVDAANAIRNARLAAQAAKSGKLTEGQTNLQLYGARMEQADKVVSDLANKGFDATSLGLEGQVGQWLPNLLKSSDRQEFEQAQRNFINAVLRRESGATITPSEFDNAQRQYFPQPGDTDSLIAQKAATRKLVIDEFRRLGQGGGATVTVPQVQTIGQPTTTATTSTPLKIGRFTVTPK